MGSPEDVVAPLSQLHEKGPALGLELVAVVSQPARPSGRGGKLADPPVAVFAKSKGVSCLQPESAKSAGFLEELRKIKPDVIVTAAYGQILSEEFLAIPQIGTINIHPSRLPEYRGATPVPAALLDGLQSTSVTILFTVKKLDAGNIILQKDFSIEPSETSGQLTARLFAASGEMLLEALTKLKKEPGFKGIPQEDAKATFCKKIDKDMGLIDWTLDAETLVNRFRAFEPWPGSWTSQADRRIAITDMGMAETIQPSNGRPGEFKFDKPSKSIVVSCGQGQVSVRRLKPAGAKDMDAPSFWNGLKDKTQTIFLASTPVSAGVINS